MTSPALGMLFGFINTATLHLAKGMQRHGIETLRWRSTPKAERSGGRAAIYVIGVVLNNMTAVWLVLANRFAPPAYATGMFGLGLVVLLFYSHVVLGEPVRGLNYAGAVIIMAGTALFAVHAAGSREIEMAHFDPLTVGLFSTVYVVATVGFVVFVQRSGRRVLLALAFGLLAGGMASLDPVLKAVGQSAAGESTVVPMVAWGWIPFLASFLLGGAAFVSVQYAFLKGADASAMIPIQSSVYVLVPVVVQLIALPGYRVTAMLVAGVVMILAGIVLTQTGRKAAASGAVAGTPGRDPAEDEA